MFHSQFTDFIMGRSTYQYNFLRKISQLFLNFVCFCNAKQQTNNADSLQGMFIFGSSVVDIGNNNFIPNAASRSNFRPYGVDYPSGPTGRFSNGKTVADLLADHLKLPVIPPFHHPQTRGEVIIHGVNFGSAGSGILNDTGSVAGKVISLNQQIGNFEFVTLPALEAQLKSQRAAILPNYLFLIAAGNNDYLINYFGQERMSPEDFAANLINCYSAQLKRLYNLGGRKFILVSVYPLGCGPLMSRGAGCLQELNDIVSIFYGKLVAMVDSLKTQLIGLDFTVVNSIQIITNIINNGTSLGFTNTNGPCCVLSLNGVTCKPDGALCEKRSSYVYFDGQHTTEAANAAIVAKVATSRETSEVYPINLHQLVNGHVIMNELEVHVLDIF